MQELEENFKKNDGSFEKYKIGDLFESFTGDVDIQNKDLTEAGDYFINSGVTNCGIKGKVTRKAKLFPANTLTVDFFGNTYYRDFSYKLATHNHVFSLSSSILKNRAVGLYISSAFSYLTKKYSFNTMLTRPQMNEEYIVLPTINNELAFDYMQDYVRVLEQDYVRELNAYLKVTGLDNYELTEEEKKVLNKNVIFKDYIVGNVFKKLNLKYINEKPFKKSDDLSTEKTNEFNLPLVNAKHGDNGIMYYGRSQDWQSEEYSIDIVNDGAIATGDVYPQPQRTSVLYNAYLIKPTIHTTEFENESVLLYISKCLEKAIKHKYGYDNKAGWEKVKEDSFKLPETDENSINFSYMQTYIRAIEKLVIKDVVDWKNKVIETTKEVVNN